MKQLRQLSLGHLPAGVPGIELWKVIRHGYFLPALIDAVPFGNGDSFSLPVQQVLPLKFIDGGNHGEHELPGRRPGVQVLFVADQMHTLGL